MFAGRKRAYEGLSVDFLVEQAKMASSCEALQRLPILVVH